MTTPQLEHFRHMGVPKMQATFDLQIGLIEGPAGDEHTNGLGVH